MSAFRLSTMFMKTHKLCPSLHDIDEKKGERRLTRGREKSAVCGIRISRGQAPSGRAWGEVGVKDWGFGVPGAGCQVPDVPYWEAGYAKQSGSCTSRPAGTGKWRLPPTAFRLLLCCLRPSADCLLPFLPRQATFPQAPASKVEEHRATAPGLSSATSPPSRRPSFHKRYNVIK